MPEINSSLQTAPTSSRWRDFWTKDTRANLPSYKIANEAQPTQELKNIEKTITMEELEFVKTADMDSLTRLLSDRLNEAEGRQEKHAHTQHSIGRIGKAAVAFANHFSSFLQAYSGIIEIMEGADQQYGGVAYSALSLLLIVAVNKQRKEQHIETALLILQREFSRTIVLQEVHSSESMKTYIADAYKLGIEFAREVTIYYSRPTHRRVFEAITKPPQLVIDLKISAITNAVTEIEKERAVLDSQRLFQVQRRVEEVKNGVDEVRVGVDEVRNGVGDSHTQNELRLLGLLKGKLLPEGNRDPDDLLAQYTREVGAAFRNIQRLSTFSFARLVQEESYSAWDGSRASCMMLLHGRTAVTKTEYSWLSPAIFPLIEQRRAQNRLVIFHLCQDRSVMENDVPAHAVLSSLISQLLAAKASVLRDEARYQDLNRKIFDPSWRTTQAKMPFAVLCELLDSFSDEDVHIILDRVDRIKGDAHGFMTSLAELIENSRSKIKLFLVSSSNGSDRIGGKMSAELQESIEDDLGSDRFWSLEWNQR
ncbi:MAG: hypothetical protein ASARMPREDX12_007665 [Alectoria sarmentosa]|nr:MAG: hypothetical protein ASARMPREDX12_007665 [Alectoria sarmentosa]CAD6592876.1 MAG: hypothetical protein ASARMPRED_006766 [Alectoria sarmentosa]